MSEIYDEKTGLVLMEDPDLTKGYIYDRVEVIGHHEELMPGTEGMGIDGHGLYKIIEDTKTKKFYHAYTEEEIKAKQTADTETKTVETRIASLEVAVDQLTLASLT